MEKHQLQNRESDMEKMIKGDAKLRQEDKQGQAAKQSPTSPASPPSASSSPSHEFSFTISLHSSSTMASDKSRAPSPFAVDLSPADDIFFHGHLLPLHLLSHLPASPRTSTNSMDSFTLPIKELLDDDRPIKDNGSCSTIDRSNIPIDGNNSESNNRGTKGGSKSKSFSLFGLTRGRKGCDDRDKEDKEKHKRKLNDRDKEDKEKHNRKLRFDVMHVLKRYLRVVQPLMLFRGRREKIRFHGQSYSFSGNLSPRDKPELRGRRGEHSAPATMRTSPTNSGHLLATACTALPAASDSTMEELQAAIQAAIAHCKNSFAKEEKPKCGER